MFGVIASSFGWFITVFTELLPPIYAYVFADEAQQQYRQQQYAIKRQHEWWFFFLILFFVFLCRLWSKTSATNLCSAVLSCEVERLLAMMARFLTLLHDLCAV